MTEFLVRHFVKDHEETEKVSVRTAYGVLASMVGIFCNVFLFAVKWLIGFFLQSISVMADAFNNLSDAGGSIISLVGVKMAEKPADKDHPFGHGRIEYIAALVVAFLVLEVGFTFFKDAVGKIREPEDMRFQVVSIVILVLSVGVKLWLSLFNRKLGKRIDSKVLLASATDAIGDVITTSATIASVLFWRITGLNIDGFVGLGVSLVIMWAGVGIARDTLEPLIGEPVSREEYEKITRFVEGYTGILGSHDLIVHNYGPGRSMASIHAEVPNDADIEESHEIIDRIERDAVKNLGIFLVIHMDPVETRDAQVLAVKKQVEQILDAVDGNVSIHDFRMVDGKEQINLIFDMVVPYEYDDKKQADLRRTVEKLLHVADPRYQCVITVERSYIDVGTE
ncbi:MAG TPA: cation diffusion facilitator family transporter [Candidatus Dorea gallistercoris]|uniref:Cation diffusion facilitator family transporter n=1 Tax=Candidatus Dorea gallistercoris TaxID=2838542 RepID=A0A9D1R7T9_9FIRM|nr:cation diffusion facilitator family transporter [Candidatus Dorea gallistercoris]